LEAVVTEARRFLSFTRSCLLGLLFAHAGAAPAQTTNFLLSQWLGQVPRHSVLAEPGYYVWGGCVVQDGGKYHMFYERWPTNTYAFGDGWLFNAEVAHAVADTPDGPFTPTGVVLGKRPNDPNFAYWDSQSQQNPHIRQFGSKFYLYFMATVDPGTNSWPGISQRNRIQRNQRIGVIVADSMSQMLDTNYVNSVRPSVPIISPVYSTNAATDRTTNPTDYAGNRIVNNQTVIQRPDGKYQLIYKSNWPQSPGYGHGFALADDPAGPFTLVPGPIFSDQAREDENHWYDAATGKYFLIVKNFTGPALEQLQSNDSTNWTSQGIQSGTIVRWEDGADEVFSALERPQLLRDTNGVPIMLYLAAQRALGGGAVATFNVHVPLKPAVVKAVPLTNASGIKASGKLLSAVNFGALTNVTVNGITFTPSGTNLANLASGYGLTQSGGSSGATLAASPAVGGYNGLPELKALLDSMVWQTGNATAGAKLKFTLTNLPLGHTCRLQLFFGETRSGYRHGPQTLDIAGQWLPGFDYGPASALVTPGTTALKIETSWIALNAAETITLSQRVTSGNGLQLSGYALHDVSAPTLVAVSNAPVDNISITWRVVPGFTYTVCYTDDLLHWAPEPAGVFNPVGSNVVDYTFTEPFAGRMSRLFRLGQAE
jgi:hypothetical protein